MDTLAVVAGLDPAGLSAAGLVDAVIASERLLSYVNFLQVSLLAELGKPNRCADVSGLVAALVGKAGMGRDADGAVAAAEVAELTAQRSVGVAAAVVAAVLDWSPVTAGIRIRQAMRMTAELPGTAAALRSGRVDVGRARMVVDRTAVLSAVLCGRVERRVLPLVAGRSKARLEALVDREVIAADPAGAERRRLAAVKGRNVCHRVDKDGMGVITALLPAESAVMVFTLVDLIAAANKGLDGRTVDQRRADAVADVAEELLTFGFVDLDGLVARAETADAVVTPGVSGDAAATAEPGEGGDGGSDAAGRPGAGSPVDRVARLVRAGTRHGRRPHLVVTGAWTTLAGVDDLPGDLEGHGTITAPLLRAIAASWGSVTAVGVDPVTGRASAVGGLTYRPGRRVCDEVITVSGWCRAAGCRIPAARCDLDHVEPFDHADPAAGGRTVASGLLPECRFHHLLKHHANWTPRLLPDMTVVWTTATGHTATSYPREFTAPGEWGRATHPDDGNPKQIGDAGCAATGVMDSGGALPGPPGGGPASGAGEVSGDGGGALPETTHRPVQAADKHISDKHITGEHISDEHIIIGPTVTGPTIPVIPAGTDYTEPNTELEDPATVPHPGSVEIHTYRALREDTRRHALRRIGRLTPRANTADPAVPLTPAQEERRDLDRTYRRARQRPPPPPDPTTDRRINALDLISHEPLPEEPPF